MNIRAFTVSQANRLIKNTLEVESLLRSIAISGEISNLKYHFTGHIYFSLKDDSNVLKCVMFKKNADLLPFKLENGIEVIGIGSVGFFEKNGSISLNCDAVFPKGQGLQNAIFEELKKNLEKEGMFDYKNKKDLPFFPKKVAVITSSTGAVIEDIKNISSRRNKNIEIVLCPVKVQGIGAENNIAEMVNYVNKNEVADVIIIARGGGSKEDLQPFNTEIVARTVFTSKIPTVSAVGHETDVTLCDLVADRRVSTPSEAAEIVFPREEELYQLLLDYESRLRKIVERRKDDYKEKLIKIKDFELYNKANIFIMKHRNIVENRHRDLDNLIDKRVITSKSDLQFKALTLDKYNPIDILKQGYSLVEKDGEIIRKSEDLSDNDKVKIKFYDSDVVAIIKKTE